MRGRLRPVTELAAQQAEQHFGFGARVLGVVLEAGALEPLHDIGLAVGGALLKSLAADRVAEQRQAAVLRPV